LFIYEVAGEEGLESGFELLLLLEGDDDEEDQ
jgi:hypothetical protein